MFCQLVSVGPSQLEFVYCIRVEQIIQPCRLQYTNIIYYLLHIVLLQGQLVFRLIGDLAGPNFFYINETTGVIYVRNNLDLDRSQNYTLRVEV